MKNILYIIILVLLITISCKSKIKTVSGNFDYETECVSSDKVGYQTVTAWGFGQTEKEAILNARRRAVDDILFKGIRGGKSVCQISPIISNPNKKRNNPRYFQAFYEENGIFNQFVGYPDENWLRQKLKINKKNKENLVYQVVVEVDVANLTSQMLNDNLIE
jgi:hypothetical protein